DGMLYESTGGQVGETGFSTLRRIHIPSGEIVRSMRLRDEYWAEGLALHGNHLIQLTWRQHIAFVYKLSDFKRVGEFRYTGEGWGLCFDGRQFVMSDGTSTLALRDRRTFALTNTIKVELDGEPLNGLNELECVGNSIYANVSKTDKIVEIAADGSVKAIID